MGPNHPISWYFVLLSSILKYSSIISDIKKFWAQILSAKRFSNQFSITSFLIKTQITCFGHLNIFQEHKLRVYIRNLETILLFSMLFYLRPYSMPKRKPLQHLLKSCKHPQTCENNIA